MEPPTTFLHPAIPLWLHYVRQLPLPALKDFATNNILPPLSLATDYIESLDDASQTIALRASILVFIASNKGIVPRRFQLESVNALVQGRDCVVDSGTGSGKTLCQIIPNLLYPDTTSITISPLKRLQILQASEFTEWGIRTVCINEDTPRDAELWQNIKNGHFQHLIVQPEQLGMHQGHLPRLAGLLNNSTFAKTISRVHVDEAHNHHAAGLPHYGIPPFRPAWGHLDEFRLRLPSSTPFQLLSGSFPPHVKTAVIEHLNFDPKTFVSLKLSSNRPNLVYATHRIVGGLSDFRNLDFLLAPPFKFKCIIFHDNTQQSADAALYQRKKLPPHLSKLGIIRHYHGGMSKDYLTAVFDDFANENGACKLLHATEGVSTGLHVSDIDAVVDYGVPQKQSTSIQRAGRCGRRGQHAVYVLMAEPWAYTASLDAVVTDSTDPDRPVAGHIKEYLADNSSIALSVDKWCCDQLHLDNPALQFDKRSFFPGRFIYQDDKGDIYAGDVDEPDRIHLNPPKQRKRKTNGVPNRKVANRAPLQALLRAWLSQAHASDQLRAVRPASWILNRNGIKALSTVHPDRMHTIEHVTAALEETPEWSAEWGAGVLSVITHFDAELRGMEAEPPALAAPNRRRTVPKENRQTGGDADWEPPQKKARMEVLSESSIPTNVRRSTRLGAAKKV
ncbi:P-loop containing nucleoside triphosphate hydrolase protein [Mycena sanguinolenta]|uniref:DNA 3'-5' helicase n=1 Tax=Mycena sanguinolenta TaxID=230812 RepID=A0A8H6YHA5_9AGAR|nr:P-loop containing nucleoside triphosphate hydrolase protein [Mycena sanguinolenta]